MGRINLGQKHSISLGEICHKKLQGLWNTRLSDPFAFTPHELRGKVELSEVVVANKYLGEFATAYLKQVLRRSNDSDKLRRLKNRLKIVAVGYGRRYDSNWLKDAVRACLETWWIDVSDLACEWASIDLQSQFAEFSTPNAQFPNYFVKQGEIRSVLSEPSSVGLELNSVEIWYLCRTIGCLSKRSARVVLQELGRSLSSEIDRDKKNTIVIINALRDYNPDYVGKTSTLPTLNMIKTNVRRGANRRVVVCFEASYRYFGKICTAMTIMAE